MRIYLGLLLSPVNFWDAWRFRRFLKREQPDLIFFNSLLRNLGQRIVGEARAYKRSLDCRVSSPQALVSSQ